LLFAARPLGLDKPQRSRLGFIFFGKINYMDKYIPYGGAQPMPKFSSLLDFQKRFPNDEACMEYLEKLRWPAGFRCPNCSHDDGYRLAHRRLIQCAQCRYQASATAGTIFHKTRTPLLIWFWIVYLVAQDKGGVSMLKLSRDLGMHYDTVWNLVHKVRTAMASRDQGISLAGFIELDEAIIGREARKAAGPHEEGEVRPRKKRLGRRRFSTAPRGKTQCEAIVMVERENMHAGNVVVKVVNSTTREEIRDLVSQRVEPNQWFKTDGNQSHWVLKSMGHKLDCYPMSGDEACEELPIVHRVISLIKRWLLGRLHGVSDRYLQCFLDEFCFRFNRRNSHKPLYESLLKACALAVPVYYPELRR
jgi:transposase-like protein/Zn ribbon nucleic-acid-binding protein